MLLLSSSTSLLINSDTLRCNLNSLPSEMTIGKSSYVALESTNKLWPIMAYFLGFLTHFCARGLTPRFSNTRAKTYLSVSP